MFLFVAYYQPWPSHSLLCSMLVHVPIICTNLIISARAVMETDAQTDKESYLIRQCEANSSPSPVKDLMFKMEP